MMVLTGTVGSPAGAGSQPIIHTSAGAIALDTRAELPAGASVTLEILGRSSPPEAPVMTTANIAGPADAGDWSMLNEAQALLQHSDPTAAQALANAIPTLGPRLAASMMTFLGALKSGNLRAWPGEATLKALERSGPSGAALARKLAAAVTSGKGEEDSGNGAGHNVSGDWRALSFPFQYAGMVDTVRFAIHPPPSREDRNASESSSGGDPGTRFLVDVTLSRLGGVQLDGLLRRGDQRFDLIVRSRTPLSSEIQREMAGLFGNSARAMNLVGTLAFQVAENFVKPEMARSRPGERMVSRYV
ncbi:MAG: hypothetical protein ABT940_05500 [Alphaproteobacteria bacterium]